ncbi:hypothetical protein LTR70_007822 [Exophiala xenobiotica]|uniref:Uncharacterized protein n=1 Tax=Lithohypha guttulata TaxID=1690604 RepID=A0ABR0K366_9EURO|nr:hypothetical protein LTR24_007433 [Lithohypha guttulata]KAK5313067.1 hypothetical protein LTR70_007822 [Exophiala xenobiotica]
MFTLPSSRRFTYPALILLAFITICRLLIGLTSSSVAFNVHGLTLRSAKKAAYEMLADQATANLSLEEQFETNYHASSPIRPVHPRVDDFFSTCTHKPNTRSVSILNISMVPSANNGERGDEFRNKQYFNPALIPLPSDSPYPYLLVSRLVTSGTHQESHICFADMCAPPTTTPLRPDMRRCTYSDVDLLGNNGGMRCVTRPERVNIPPTPARRCTGAWTTFPHIPGFHDPRVFWSGRGEPLVEVNSGSTYGCVGLWLQDLRAVYPALDEVLAKNVGHKRDSEIKEGADENKGKNGGMDLTGLGSRMGYPYLTELMRNPRDSRNEVEKNWVLFFPNDEEAWVQYDVMGKTSRNGALAEEDPQTKPSPISKVPETSITGLTVVEDQIVVLENPMHEVGLQKRAGSEGASDLDASGSMQGLKPADFVKQAAVSLHGAPALNPVALARSSSSPVEATSISPDPTMITTIAPFANASLFPLLPTSITAGRTADTSPAYRPSVPSVHGGRTIAQLLSHGFATPNLTSLSEPSCFNLTDPAHEHDTLNNTGHWHQGTNSLRLILCTRQHIRSRTCLSTTPSPESKHAKQQDYKPMNRDEYENMLIDEGIVVHFSIIHRKFSNTWKLPMRYERYFLVWEARRPFRTLAVSHWPVLFGDERARPWSWEEDVGSVLRDAKAVKRSGNETMVESETGEDEAEQSKKGNSGSWSHYFTYTPSTAWAWRGKSEDEPLHRARGHESLGTGYLGDEIVVGIGMDDVAQGIVKVKIDDVLKCMRMCPGVADEGKEP